MKKVFSFTFLILGVFFSSMIAIDVPTAEISNGLIKAKLYLPDQNHGYYRGTRFDWSGVISSLTYKEHSFFSEWFESYHPKVHDAITGPAQAFIPLNYDSVDAGQTFIQVGVGALLKDDTEKYKFSKTYSITNPGVWTFKKSPEAVEFKHVLVDSSGYSYEYYKTVRLTSGKPQLVLEHILKNTGKKAIETSVYNHNFFVIDEAPTGPSIQIKFPYQVSAAGQGWGTLAQTNKDQINYLRTLKKGENVFTSALVGFGTTAKDYDLKIENVKTGAGVRIRGDRPLEKMAFWASSTTSCPEPYIKINVKPGNGIKWNTYYDFYTFPPALGY